MIRAFVQDSTLTRKDVTSLCVGSSETESPVVVARKNTASASVSDFFQSITQTKGKKPLMMLSVGLRVGGRSSVYDLYYSNTVVYAVDVRDPNYVGIMKGIIHIH
jgi:hypothetical protein